MLLGTKAQCLEAGILQLAGVRGRLLSLWPIRTRVFKLQGASESPSGLTKTQNLGPRSSISDAGVWDGAWDTAFLTNSQARLLGDHTLRIYHFDPILRQEGLVKEGPWGQSNPKTGLGSVMGCSETSAHRAPFHLCLPWSTTHCLPLCSLHHPKRMSPPLPKAIIKHK